jgi:hypothetical protein
MSGGHDPTGDGLSGTNLSPRTSIISHPCGEAGNGSNRSGSGRSANVPISDEAPRGRGTIGPSSHGQTVGHRRGDGRVRKKEALCQPIRT